MVNQQAMLWLAWLVRNNKAGSIHVKLL
uniref:Uncharacterized protein n=1 Tax=Musa acuminata subsp. malaccensis TaxID=214687 RepID=A0A804HMM2_MUSAM